MATLSDDLRMLADMEEKGLVAASAGASTPGGELQKINWQRLICFAIPAFNMVAPIWGLPPLPVPPFCTNPPPPPPSPVA